MTCKDIVIEYLQAHGYQGVVNQDYGCGCGLKDMAPGECNILECVPAYEVIRRCEDCEAKECESRSEDGQEKPCYTTEKPVRFGLTKIATPLMEAGKIRNARQFVDARGQRIRSKKDLLAAINDRDAEWFDAFDHMKKEQMKKAGIPIRDPARVTPADIQDETDADGRVISDADPGL